MSDFEELIRMGYRITVCYLPEDKDYKITATNFRLTTGGGLRTKLMIINKRLDTALSQLEHLAPDFSYLD